MDLLPAHFFSALLSIVVIDLVLGGDNAIVIGMAARNLPGEQQKKVVFWGALGAIAVRSILTTIVVWLLKIPGLMLFGGVLLIGIAYKLLVEEKGQENIASQSGFWSAIKTIIIADACMGLDNVLGVAGAASGSFILVVTGLLISVPIMMWGSTLILKWIERFPAIIYIGAGVLAWTASKMLVSEPFIKGYFDENAIFKWLLAVIVVAGVLLAGRMQEQKLINSKPINVKNKKAASMPIPETLRH